MIFIPNYRVDIFTLIDRNPSGQASTHLQWNANPYVVANLEETAKR